MGIHQELIRTMTQGLPCDRAVIGPHLTAVCAGERCGLSTTQAPAARPHARSSVESPGLLEGTSLAELAELVFSQRPMEAGLGMAAVNAGLPIDGLEFSEGDGVELLKEKAEALDAVVVGHFNFVHDLSGVAKSVSVLELEPVGDDLPASASPKVIPEAEIVVITGSAFANHTIERLLDLAKGKWTMVIGPTAPLSPLLFDYGVDAVAGTLVTDKGLTVSQVSQGAIYRQLTGVKKVLLRKV